MSHDLYASWASSELANLCTNNPLLFFENTSPQNQVLSYAGKDTSSIWPIADGVLNIDINPQSSFFCAIEFKRENEGIHGLLTALGQAISYLEKGFNGSIIVIPTKYSTHPDPGKHLVNIISLTLPNAPIAVFTYEPPDTNSSTPFRDKLTCMRPMKLDVNSSSSTTSRITSKNIIKTQWAHLREGCAEADSVFKYLQICKQLDPNIPTNPSINFSPEILQALNTLNVQDPMKYLAYCPNDSFCDYVWRNYWYKYVLTPEVMKLYNIDSSGTYSVNEADSLLLQNDETSFKKFFYGRSDSIKSKLVDRLNSNLITEENAYIEFVENIRNRAHSYREDLDSTLLHIGLIYNDSKPTPLAYKFLDICERGNTAYSPQALSLFSYAILKEGDLASFLFYVYKLSENIFSASPMAFTIEKTTNAGTRFTFDRNAYIDHISNALIDDLKVQTYTLRGGQQRKHFQAELATLRFLGIVNKFRVGVGLEINWPKVIDILSMKI